MKKLIIKMPRFYGILCARTTQSTVNSWQLTTHYAMRIHTESIHIHVLGTESLKFKSIESSRTCKYATKISESKSKVRCCSVKAIGYAMCLNE